MRITTRQLAIALAAIAIGLGSTASAEPTDITVRVISRDAKFIGTSMGGVQVTLRDAYTGELLAEGKTRGGTGDTTRIMKEPSGRSPVLATEDAAAFRTTLDIDRPRLVELTAQGPLAQRQSANRVSATQWVIPGKDLSGGNGWMVELPGFVVDVLAPPTHQKRSGLPAEVTLRANVTMMCGCPIEPDGLWDANDYEVAALLYRDGERAGVAQLEYAGETSQFAGTLQLAEPGTYEAIVYAYDRDSGNTGVDRVTFVLSP
ncbi:hypothetical protein [Arhodomonas sp. AD133]|uniref:hypothetical protein n=1 Tax=Arhodomonas sp. AD133 TaxID=3415009 RepID=UPI003EBFDB67